VTPTKQKKTTPKPNITFFDHGDPDAALQSLQSVLAEAGELPVIGLVVETTERDGQKQITNWTFADTSLIKSLAMILPGK
jgi:hypothetical protein